MPEIEYYPFYKPLATGPDVETRLLNILPKSADESDKIKCKIEAVSFNAFTEQYSQFKHDFDQPFTTKRSLHSLWKATKRQSEGKDGAAGDKDWYPTDSSLHRFEWGDYAALSYTWGDPKNTQELIVNDCAIQVTRNLYEALYTLRDLLRFQNGYKIWVDALCINQLDKIEREYQVSLMREIYGNSWAVVSWLGNNGEFSDHAFHLLKSLAPTFDAPHEDGFKLHETLKLNPVHFGQGCWVGFWRLFARPYWKRLWIIQELALGNSDTIVFCGKTTIRWDHLCKGMGVIFRYLWNVKNNCLAHDRNYFGIPGGADIDAFVLHKVWKDLWPASEAERTGVGRLEFGRILEVSNFSLAADPRDKVYGVLALMEERLGSKISADYTVDTRDLLVTFATAYIAEYRNMELLRECNPWGKLATPSWVPDLTWSGRLRDNRPPWNYNSSSNAPAEWKILKDSLHMTVKAIIVDRVDGIGAQGSGIKSWHENSVIQSYFQKSVYGDHTATEHALARLLFGDRPSSSHRHMDGLPIDHTFLDPGTAALNLPKELGPALSRFRELGWDFLAREEWFYFRWGRWRDANESLQIAGRELKDFFKDEVTSEHSESLHYQAYTSWIRTHYGRRMITTEKGYLGWAPDNREGNNIDQTRKGDVVCIVFGCSTPIILRPEGDFYKVVGEGYIQGLMEGEALGMVERKELVVEHITLC